MCIRDSLQLVQRHHRLLPVVPPDKNALVLLHVLGADLQPQGHAFHLILGEFPAGGVVRVVQLYTEDVYKRQAFALISWLRNPYGGNRAEVRVNTLRKGEAGWMWAAAGVVTVGFYFILDAFHTANLLPSTLSVTTSFLADVYKRQAQSR